MEAIENNYEDTSSRILGTVKGAPLTLSKSTEITADECDEFTHLEQRC